MGHRKCEPDGGPLCLSSSPAAHRILDGEMFLISPGAPPFSISSHDLVSGLAPYVILARTSHQAGSEKPGCALHLENGCPIHI